RSTLSRRWCVSLCAFDAEVIETPLSLPDDIKKKLNLESRQRGRIWRVVPEDFQANPMGKCDPITGETRYAWGRETGYRLAYETATKEKAVRTRGLLLDDLNDD